MLSKAKQFFSLFLDFPKKFLSPRMYDIATFSLIGALALVCGYIWLNVTLAAAGLLLLGGIIGEGYCMSKFKQHVFQYVPKYFLENDNWRFFQKAEKNTLTPVEAKYFLAKRWFRPACDYAMVYPNKNLTINTTLHMAAKFGRGDLIKIYLAHGVDLNRLDLFEQTPLYCAAKEKQSGIISLLGNKKNVNTTIRTSKNTALHAACETGDLNTIKALCAIGGNILQQNSLGITPLSILMREIDIEKLKFLIETLKIDLSKPLGKEVYAIHLLAVENKIDCLTYLLSKIGKDGVNQPNKSGFTARDIAHLYRFTEAEQLLAEKGGKLTRPEVNYQRLRQKLYYNTQEIVKVMNQQSTEATTQETHKKLARRA